MYIAQIMPQHTDVIKNISKLTLWINRSRNICPIELAKPQWSISLFSVWCANTQMVWAFRGVDGVFWQRQAQPDRSPSLPGTHMSLSGTDGPRFLELSVSVNSWELVTILIDSFPQSYECHLVIGEDQYTSPASEVSRHQSELRWFTLKMAQVECIQAKLGHHMKYTGWLLTNNDIPYNNEILQIFLYNFTRSINHRIRPSTSTSLSWFSIIRSKVRNN